MSESTNRFEFAAKVVLFLIAALLPLWVFPGMQNVDFGREITFGALILAALILWLLSVLTSGEIRFRHSPLLYAAALLFIMMGVSTFFSRAPLYSAILADPVAEKLSTLLLGILLMIVAGSVLRRKKDVGWLLLVLIFSGAIAALLYVTQLLFDFSLYRFITSSAAAKEFSIAGTVNAASLFYVTLLLCALGFMVSAPARAFWPVVRYALYASAGILAALLLVVNFRTGWIVLLGSCVFCLGLLFKDNRHGIAFSGEDTPMKAKRRGMGWRSSLIMGFLALAALLTMIRIPLFKNVAIPGEISPNVQATTKIAWGVWQEESPRMFFGSGPGTFGLDWNLYKDAAFNLPQNVAGNIVDLWNIRFNQGFGLFWTYLATVGMFGTAALLIFFLTALVVLLRRMLTAANEEISFATSAFLGFVAIFLATFLYPANFTLLLFLFLCLGALSVLLSRPAKSGAAISVGEQLDLEDSAPQAESKSFFADFWEVTERTVRFESSWAVFLSSLASVFILVLCVAALYFQIGRVQAVYGFQKASAALAEGKVDDAISRIEEVVLNEEYNFRHHIALTQARIEKVRAVIGRAAAGENVQQEFLSLVAKTEQNADRAVTLHRSEPSVWRTRGALYELIIPFLRGSEKLAFESYRRSTELDPLNPAAWVELGRTALTYADRLQLLASQRETNSGDREQMLAARVQSLKEAERAFQKAVEVKPDFAQTHFLAAQTAIRLGDIQGAIRSTENARNNAPLDIGIAFQLGLLYYQTNDLNKAQGEFERAVALNQNYSNARYFLGLIYDRKGEKDRAIQQFDEIQKFNPDNQEVQKILINLRAGKAALAGIVPPGEPPEKRKETPVREGSRR